MTFLSELQLTLHVGARPVSVGRQPWFHLNSYHARAKMRWEGVMSVSRRRRRRRQLVTQSCSHADELGNRIFPLGKRCSVETKLGGLAGCWL